MFVFLIRTNNAGCQVLSQYLCCLTHQLVGLSLPGKHFVYLQVVKLLIISEEVFVFKHQIVCHNMESVIQSDHTDRRD